MYVEMLRDGHAEPEIVETGGDVLRNLFGGAPDEDVRSFFDDLADRDAGLTEDAAAHIAVSRLLGATPLRPEALADAAQCTRGEASRTLERLERTGVIERLVNRSRSFRLTGSARERLRGRLAYASRSPLDEHWETVRAYLDTNAEIGREEVVALLGLKATQASTVLSALYRDRGVIEPVGNARGRGVRYRLTDRH
jgi:DNA-binding MarR family transcriptional regulator